MRFIRTKAAIAVAGLALSLAACGDAGSDSEGVDVEASEDASFEAGTRMAELADAGTINVGVKYDQPGLGFNETGSDMPTGFDVDVAKILVASLGIDPEDTSKVKYIETISDNREPFLEEGKVDIVLASYSITDERRAVVGQAGPYMVTGQQLLVPEDSDGREPGRPAGQGGLLRDRLDVARQRQGRGHEAGRLRHLQPVRRQGARRHRRGDDDRRHDPGRLRRAERGPAQGRRRARSPRSASASATRRTPRRCASGSSTR